VRARWVDPLASETVLGDARETLARVGTLHVSGAMGPARLLLPLLLTDVPLLFVVPRERDVEIATGDLKVLVRELGLPGGVFPFPAPGPSPFRGLPRHPEASLRRAVALHAASRGDVRALIASPAGLLRPVLNPRLFETRVLSLRQGEEMTPEILLEALDEGGYRVEDPVVAAGQVARRGGILDLFPPDREKPVRLEFLGDTIESLRSFNPETQRTESSLDEVEILPLLDLFLTRSTRSALRDRLKERLSKTTSRSSLLDQLDRGVAPEEIVEMIPLVAGATVAAWDHMSNCAVAVLDPEAVVLQAEAYRKQAQDKRGNESLMIEPEEALVPAEVLKDRLAQAPALHLREVDAEERGLHISFRPVRRYSGDIRSLIADLRSQSGRTILFLANSGRADRLKALFDEEGIGVGPEAAIELRIGALSGGFEAPDAKLRLLADGDVFPEEVHVHPRGRGAARSFLSDFRDLKVGDLVVHQDHGIGRFAGLETLEVGGASREFMVLLYLGGDKLKVPIDAFDRVQKYMSVDGTPLIDRLGGGGWERVKKRVKRAMRDMAAELLKLYAERRTRLGHAFTGESPWQREFEEAFEYEETHDQRAAIADVAADMASEHPMDRLICGDVGYGKTEVAMRAAMRAVLDSKQVAILAPTTILALQHWKTFRSRFAAFPVRVELASRFRHAKEMRATLAALAQGGVDVIIGTHRLLSKDVVFKDLGLLVIDEEQRFGVAAKERLKYLRTTVDCLILSATPIPRTLQMGLAGIRDMSVIETPPKDRLAIQTSIVKFSTDTIAAVIRQELSRDGQVYFVHNRVESIYSLASMVQRLVPEARVVVAHGQMPESLLEKSMLAFIEGRADVLVATTIVENGLDIPRVNTIVVNRADRFGLAQLYQLRGRVGRSDRRAYAYLLVPPDTVLSEIARKRLAAIQEFSELGAGFRIAALDLELRGAGNLLGGEQSGHIQAVGLDLYVKLLEQAILEMKGEAPRQRARATLNLRVNLKIPAEYVPEVHQRMSLYKRLSQVRDEAEIAALREEILDRYGNLPPEVQSLLAFAGLKLRAEALEIEQVDVAGGNLHLRFGAETPVSPDALVGYVRSMHAAALSPQGVLRIPLGNPPDAVAALGATLSRLGEAVHAGVGSFRL